MVAIAALLGLLAAGCSGSSPPAASAPSKATPAAAARTAAARFLDRYVTGDGRVIRHDQGGDIVSEGQAYGMLLAEIAGRPDTARTIWAWTSRHLARTDGLLRFHASGSGAVLDDQSAADADVLAAYALLRYRGQGAASLHDAGRRLAGAVLAHETVIARDQVVVAAGPWALATTPPTVDPSYLMPGVFDALARYTGDNRWRTAASTAERLIADLTDDGRRLPPDWAAYSADRLVPVANPGGGAPIQYGLDAQRLALWFATACTSGARSLAGKWWTNLLSVDDRAANLALSLDGNPLGGATNALPLMAGAAAATAAGRTGDAQTLSRRAAQQAKAVPTYYGDAWLALGTALLDGSLSPCEEATP